MNTVSALKFITILFICLKSLSNFILSYAKIQCFVYKKEYNQRVVIINKTNIKKTKQKYKKKIKK